MMFTRADASCKRLAASVGLIGIGAMLVNRTCCVYTRKDVLECCRVVVCQEEVQYVGNICPRGVIIYTFGERCSTPEIDFSSRIR